MLMKKKMGRPPKAEGDVRTVVAHANFTKEEKRKIVAAAEAAGISVSDYIRGKVLMEAK